MSQIGRKAMGVSSNVMLLVCFGDEGRRKRNHDKIKKLYCIFVYLDKKSKEMMRHRDYRVPFVLHTLNQTVIPILSTFLHSFSYDM